MANNGDNSLGSRPNDYIQSSRRGVKEQSVVVAKLVVYLLVLVVVFAIVWAYFAPIEEYTMGDGKVIASSEMQVVEHLEGGIVKSINVKEGDRVEAGEVLVVLDNARFKADHAENLTKIAVYDAEIARLEAEAKGGQVIEFPESFEKEHPKLAKEARDHFKSNVQALAGSIGILERSQTLMAKELHIIKPLAKQGVMSDIDLIRLERQLNELEGQILEKKEKARADAQSQLNKILSERSVLQERVKSSLDRMTRTTIRSPVKGIVNQVYVSTIGEVVQSGSKVLEIVPLDDKLTIQAYIKPSNIGFIHPGQDALVKVSAYDFSIYGGLKAKVTTISADSITDQAGASFYEVKLKTDKNSFKDAKGKKLEIIPGMTVTVNVITGKKTVMDYILKPFYKAKFSALRER